LYKVLLPAFGMPIMLTNPDLNWLSSMLQR
jgi:hypothetical protein